VKQGQPVWCEERFIVSYLSCCCKDICSSISRLKQRWNRKCPLAQNNGQHKLHKPGLAASSYFLNGQSLLFFSVTILKGGIEYREQQ